MAKKKNSSKGRGKRLSRKQLLQEILRASNMGKALYEFHPGAKKMDFIELYCEGLIVPGGTNKAGWVITEEGEEDLGYLR